MTLASNLHLRRWFLLAFALVCIGLNISVYVLYTKNQEVTNAQDWVMHTYEVIDRSNALFFKLQDMHVAQRGYLLTGDEKFLQPYYEYDEFVKKRIDGLIQLTIDNLKQQKQLALLKSTFNQQLSLMNDQIKTRRETGGFVAEDMMKSKRLMDRVRLLNEKVLGEEQRLLGERVARDNARQANYFRTIFATAGISILGLLGANAIIGLLSIRRLDAEEDLRRTNQEMEGFTYIASHDLRSPLVNLKGFSSEMANGLDELRPMLDKVLSGLSEKEQQDAKMILDTDIPDALRFIHSSVEKMDKLTNAILELSRIGKRQLKIQPIHIRGIIERSINALQHQITQKNVTVTLGDLPDVVSDPLSLEQVFGNLLDNAVKYLDPGRPGQIEIGGDRDKKQTTYWVRDNGRGISGSDTQKIFEIYRRAGNNKDIPGEGMGMAYVRNTLRRLGGRIWCESTPNTGSTFYFTVQNVIKKEGKNA